MNSSIEAVSRICDEFFLTCDHIVDPQFHNDIVMIIVIIITYTITMPLQIGNLGEQKVAIVVGMIIIDKNIIITIISIIIIPLFCIIITSLQ